MQTYHHRLEKWIKCQSKVRHCFLLVPNEQPSIHPSKKKHIDTHRTHTLPKDQIESQGYFTWGGHFALDGLCLLASILGNSSLARMCRQIAMFFFSFTDASPSICPWKLRSCMAVCAYLIMSLQESFDYVCMNGGKSRRWATEISPVGWIRLDNNYLLFEKK